MKKFLIADLVKSEREVRIKEIEDKFDLSYSEAAAYQTRFIRPETEMQPELGNCRLGVSHLPGSPDRF